VHSDAELHRWVDDARREGRRPPAVALLGGSMMRAVGGSGDAGRLEREVAILPVDLVRVTLDGSRTVWAAAHVVVRRTWWRGRVVAAMNAQFLGDFDVTPRAHPNDGKVDVLDVAASMPVRERWQARGRLPSGTHLPHPAISVRQLTTVELGFDRPMRVWADGVAVGSATTVSLEVEPDAYLVCV
jgi:hypothetical protein